MDAKKSKSILAEFKDVAHLTDAEHRVFCKLGSGTKTRRIASTSKRSLKTIEAQIGSIRKKLGLKNIEGLRRLSALYVDGLNSGKFERRPVEAQPRCELVAL